MLSVRVRGDASMIPCHTCDFIALFRRTSARLYRATVTDAATVKLHAVTLSHWRTQGGRGPAPNGRAKIFFVKTEGLSSLHPAKSGRACYDNPTGRGYFYQMPNMYTCMAYLIEIRKYCSKTWFIKVLILRPKML